MKKKSSNLSKVETPCELISYLSLNDRLKSSKQVYHYTSLSSILSILKSGYWIVRSPRRMNDSFEYQNWAESDWKNIFFISFMSEQKENIGMWSMYAQPWSSGIKVAIDTKVFKAWIKKTKIIYKANSETFEVDENIVFEVGKTAKVKFSAVAYSDFELLNKTECIHVGSAINKKLKKATGIQLLAGYIKNDAWDYEKEIRLRVELDKSIDCDAVAIKLSQEIIDAITIVKGPRFEGNLQERIDKEVKLNIPNDMSLFFNRISYIPCDKCIYRSRDKPIRIPMV